MEYNFKGYKISGELLDYIAGRLTGSGFLGYTCFEEHNKVISLVRDLAEAKGVKIEQKRLNGRVTESSIPDWDCWWNTVLCD